MSRLWALSCGSELCWRSPIPWEACQTLARSSKIGDYGSPHFRIWLYPAGALVLVVSFSLLRDQYFMFKHVGLLQRIIQVVFAGSDISTASLEVDENGFHISLTLFISESWYSLHYSFHAFLKHVSVSTAVNTYCTCTRLCSHLMYVDCIHVCVFLFVVIID